VIYPFKAFQRAVPCVSSAAALAWLLLLAGLLMLSGCASTPADAGSASQPSQAQGSATASTRTANPADPWEAWNRKVFAFNDTIDSAVLKPTSQAYVAVVPQFVRTGVNNFFGNFTDLWSGANKFLQGKPEGGFTDLARVGLNTIYGFGGLIDIASEAGLQKNPSDFGQTLARWGASSGPFVMLPLLGPSTLRDTMALPVDMTAVSPTSLAPKGEDKAALMGLNVVNRRAGLLDATKMLDDVALDRYSFLRDAYLQRRRAQTGEETPYVQEERFDEPSPSDIPANPAVTPISPQGNQP
jgi:phospholipid-binding lipoprotein MlaA